MAPSGLPLGPVLLCTNASRKTPASSARAGGWVPLGHHGFDCTFETILRRYELTDPVLLGREPANP